MYTQFKSNDTREIDRQELRRDYQATSDPKARRIIDQAGQKIRNEGSWEKSAREALLREVRRGNTANSEDIKREIFKKQHGHDL